jgi:hypothetical protein
MLRITYTGTPGEQLWTLCGQLAGPWVGEFKSNWEKEVRRFAGAARHIVDLSDVTLIDESGESLLRELRSAGVEFVAGNGVETRDLVENIGTGGVSPVRKYLARHEGRNDETDLGKNGCGTHHWRGGCHH